MFKLSSIGKSIHFSSTPCSVRREEVRLKGKETSWRMSHKITFKHHLHYRKHTIRCISEDNYDDHVSFSEFVDDELYEYIHWEYTIKQFTDNYRAWDRDSLKKRVKLRGMI